MSLAPLIAVVGPSGVGKDSVMAALAARAGFRLVRRVITRREGAGGEVFERVAEAEFRHRQARGDFALSWQAHGLHYGIPADLDALRRDGPGVLVNLSRGVLLEAQAVFAPLVVLSLSAAPEVLAARLAARGREGAADRARRLSRAGTPLPEGLDTVIAVDNSGALDQTVAAILARLQPESA